MNNKQKKILRAILDGSGTVSMEDLSSLLRALGFALRQGSGLRQRLLSEKYGMLSLHVPHGGEPSVPKGMMKRLRESFLEKGIHHELDV